jgi:hypothetical protein
MAVPLRVISFFWPSSPTKPRFRSSPFTPERLEVQLLGNDDSDRHDHIPNRRNLLARYRR